MLLGLPPQLPADEVLCSIVAFRIVYYANPDLCGLIVLIRPLKSGAARPQKTAISPIDTDQAEVQVITQNGGYIMRTAHGFSAVWPTTQTLTALFNPLAGGMDAARSALKSEATFQSKIPFVYKCNARNASVLRQHVWSIMLLSDDAMIALQNFDLNTPALRTLRTKLRAANIF